MSEQLETTEVESKESTEDGLSEGESSYKDELLKAMMEPEEEDVPDNEAEVEPSVEETPVEGAPVDGVPEVEEETQVPEWVGEFKVEEDDFVTPDGTKLPVDLVQDVITWREGGGKAEWMRKPLDEFESDEQKQAYKWGQGTHDKWKNEQKKGDTFVTDDAKNLYSTIKDDPKYAPFLSKIDELLESQNQPKTESGEIKQQEVKQLYEDKQAEIVQRLKNGEIDEADAMGMFAEANTIFKTELEESMREEARSIAREESKKTMAEERKGAQERKLKLEHAELMEDRGYSDMFADVGADGLSPIERIGMYGDPLTGQFPKSLREAYKMCLQYQRDPKGASVNLRTLRAQPNGMQTSAEENPVSAEEEGMSASERMLRDIKAEMNG